MSGTICELGRGLGIPEERVQELLSLLKSVASGENPMTPEEFLKQVTGDEQFSVTDGVFISFLVGSYIHCLERHAWQAIGVPEKRETELMQILENYKKGKPAHQVDEHLRFIIRDHNLCVPDRSFLAFVCGSGYEFPDD